MFNTTGLCPLCSHTLTNIGYCVNCRGYGTNLSIGTVNDTEKLQGMTNYLENTKDVQLKIAIEALKDIKTRADTSLVKTDKFFWVEIEARLSDCEVTATEALKKIGAGDA